LRKKNADSLKAIIEAWASTRTAEECVNTILASGVPAAPIYDIEQVCKDKNIVEAREMLVKVQHPEAGELTILGNPIKMSEYPCTYHKSAPDLGEDDDEVLKEVGFSDEQIAKLRADGAIK
jgi:formyl-CoA transferase